MFDTFFSFTDFDIHFSISLLNISLILLSIISLKLLFTKNMLETIRMMSVFSLLISLSYLLMHAPDVAMTEVALGSCLSTCVLLNFLKRFNSSINDQLKQVKVNRARRILSAILCLSIILILTWISLDLPGFWRSNKFPSAKPYKQFLYRKY